MAVVLLLPLVPVMHDDAIQRSASASHRPSPPATGDAAHGQLGRPRAGSG